MGALSRNTVRSLVGSTDLSDEAVDKLINAGRAWAVFVVEAYLSSKRSAENQDVAPPAYRQSLVHHERECDTAPFSPHWSSGEQETVAA